MHLSVSRHGTNTIGIKRTNCRFIFVNGISFNGHLHYINNDVITQPEQPTFTRRYANKKKLNCD